MRIGLIGYENWITLLPPWLEMLDEVKQLLHDLPIESSRQLFKLWK